MPKCVFDVPRYKLEMEIIYNVIKNEECGADIHEVHNIQDDSGGCTKYGISARFIEGLQKTGSFYYMPAHQYVKELTLDEAVGLYRQYFMGPLRKVPDAILPAVFSCAVNCGVGKSIRLLQQAVNVMNRDLIADGIPPLAVDGIIGPNTSTYVNHLCESSSDHLLSEFVRLWLAYYLEIANANPSQEKFLRGWRKRAEAYMPK